MAEPRVVITGIGAVTALGVGIEENFSVLLDGRSGIGPIELFPPGKFESCIAGEIKEFSARKFVPKNYRKAVKVMARDIEITVAAADLAFRDAGVVTQGTAEDDQELTHDGKRIGCNIGAGLICAELNELGQAVNTAVTDGRFDYKEWGRTGISNLTPLWLLKYLPNMLSCHVTIIHGAMGPSNCITCGDAAGPMSVGEAALYIRRNAADVVVAGSAESKLNPMGLMRQLKLGRLYVQPDQSGASVRPFDAAHNGTAVGEGGGLMILEELHAAQRRGASCYAEVAGFGGACDPEAIDLLRPTAGNLSSAVRKALRQANVSVDEVDAIAAYGTGVPGEDAVEAAEWEAVFGERLTEIPAFSATGAIGCLFAGGGSAQLALAAKAVQAQIVPPTVNFSTPAEGCKLSLSDRARKTDIRILVAAAYTVGGQSGAVVLKRVDQSA
jgi:3-oxoacyl-[acyl-carrier-protein] synthase II